MEYSLNDLIINLVNQNILTYNYENDKYKCICNSIIDRKYIRKHLNSKKHQLYEQKYEQNEQKYSKECDICYEEKSDFYGCIQCRNEYCLHCYDRIEKCPFCRISLMDIKLKYELDKKSKEILFTQDVKKKLELYYHLCCFILKHKDIFTSPTYQHYYDYFKENLLNNAFNGFTHGIFFYDLIYGDL